jgi:PKD repeat protein
MAHNRLFYRCAPAAAAALFSLACSNPNDGNGAPVARFSAVCAALRCDFTDQSTDDESISTWDWSFGDGATATDKNPFHLYAAPGTYSVTLTVHDAQGASDAESQQVSATPPVVAELTCEDASAPGGFVACSLRLETEAGFNVVLVTSSCQAHGNIFRITAPIVDTLTTDGCYEPDGTQITVPGPFPAQTEITAEIIAPRLGNPPRLLVNGTYPEWTMTYEDGDDADFNDLVIRLTAMPTS